jgi:uncharacterized membrane protein YgaE (UPF0421/DUF939 family)
MQSLATRTRVNQITILVAISFLFYQLSNWQHAIWVVISTVAVAAPFSTFLSFQKAQFRFVGTLIGLVVSCGLEYYLKFNPSHLPVLAVIIAFIAGFMAIKSYRYFIIVITVCVCLVYSYMNMPYTSLTPVSFLIDRAMGVFAGVLIFFLMQRFVFGNGNSVRELQEESYETLSKLEKTLQEYKGNPTLTSAYKCAADIAANAQAVESYIGTASLTFGGDGYPALCFAKQVATLNRRALRLLIDEPSVAMDQIDQLLRVVTAKLARNQN